jgi:hypothetical protein
MMALFIGFVAWNKPNGVLRRSEMGGLECVNGNAETQMDTSNAILCLKRHLSLARGR